MAAPTVNELREAIATLLDAIPDTQVSAYLLGNFTPPCLQVMSGEIPYDASFGRGSDTYSFKVQALVGLPTDISAQKLLGRYADSTGTYSVYAALTADKTLGGIAQDLEIQMASEEQIYTMSDRHPVIGREWAIEVTAPGV